MYLYTFIKIMVLQHPKKKLFKGYISFAARNRGRELSTSVSLSEKLRHKAASVYRND